MNRNEIMNKIQITNIYSDLFKAFRETYETSFPIFEQRTIEQQNRAFLNHHYKLFAYTNKEDRFIGFISYWEFTTYIYVEHFAIEKSHRGKNYGSNILETFLHEKRSENKKVILEIDPPSDSTSIARLHFYERAGMKPNAFCHIHPPYRKDFQPHSLLIMSAQEEIAEEEYRIFFNDLKEIIMK